MAKKKTKGWWVSPPGDIKERIAERCEESMREPGVEICFILRDYFRREDRLNEDTARKEAELEEKEREMNERLSAVEEEH